MTDRNDALALQVQECLARQDLLLKRTQNTDLTATAIKTLVEQLPELLRPEEEEKSLGLRLTELLTALEAELRENSRQQAEIVDGMKRLGETTARKIDALKAEIVEKMTRLEAAAERQAHALEALNRALYVEERDGTQG